MSVSEDVGVSVYVGGRARWSVASYAAGDDQLQCGPRLLPAVPRKT